MAVVGFIDRSNLVLEGSRVTLRPYSKVDYPGFQELLNDKETMASLQRFFARDHWTLEMIEERYDRFIREESEGSGLSFSVFRKTDRKLVGDCGFRDIGKSGKTAEFGIILHRSVWGKAFVTETRLLCYEYAFTELGLDAIRMMTDQDNLRNLGFLKKFQIRQVAEDKSGYRHFEVTKAEWPDIRSAFESELRRK